MKKNQHTLYLIILLLSITQVSAQFEPIVKLSEINDQSGLVITNGDNDLISQLREIGDVNNDGISDLIIGEAQSSINGQKVTGAFVVYGTAQSLPNPFDLSLIDGNNGFALNMDVIDGRWVNAINGVGDVNADGIDDIIFGASSASITEAFAGATFVIFGQSQNFPAIFDLSSLDGSNGFMITGIDVSDQSGQSVEVINDMNNDLIDDIIKSAPNAESNLNSPDVGSVYVVYGSQQPVPAVLDLATLNGSNGFVIYGEESFDRLGESISAADFNNDGLSDLILSTQKGNNTSGNNAGLAYVVFGSSQGFPDVFNLTTLSGNNGFVIQTPDYTPLDGSFDIINVNYGGDMNNDGIDDFTVAYPSAVIDNNAYAGAVYVLYGTQLTMPAAFNLSKIDGTNGFKIIGNEEFDSLGYATNSTGDVNADGIDDLILTLIKYQSPGYTEPFIAAYVVFGNSNGFPATYDPSKVNGNNGFALESIDGTVFSVLSDVSAAGDFNKDGVDDLAVTSRGNGFVLLGKSDLIFSNSFE